MLDLSYIFCCWCRISYCVNFRLVKLALNCLFNSIDKVVRFVIKKRDRNDNFVVTLSGAGKTFEARQSRVENQNQYCLYDQDAFFGKTFGQAERTFLVMRLIHTFTLLTIMSSGKPVIVLASTFYDRMDVDFWVMPAKNVLSRNNALKGAGYSFDRVEFVKMTKQMRKICQACAELNGSTPRTSLKEVLQEINLANECKYD